MKLRVFYCERTLQSTGTYSVEQKVRDFEGMTREQAVRFVVGPQPSKLSHDVKYPVIIDGITVREIP